MVYVFFAHGFEEIEAVTPVDVLRRAGVTVKTVGVGSKTITGTHGITVHCDMSHRELALDKMKMIVLPGGMPGAANLEASPEVQKAIDYAAAKGLWIAAICAAPQILAHKGLLDGKKATVYPDRKGELASADYQTDAVVCDGSIITANGPAAAMAFSLKLAEVLTSTEQAQQIAQDMQCQTL